MTKRERCEIAAVSRRNKNNCTQSILLAFEDKLDLPREKLMAISSGFGVGMRCGCVCGALSGAVLVLGILYPAMEDMDSKKKNSQITKEMTNRFREQFSYFNCPELRGAQELHGTALSSELVGEDDHCANMIVSTVDILCDYLEELSKE